MQTWIFEIARQEASVYRLNSPEQSRVFHRLLRVRRAPHQSLEFAHARLLCRVVEELSLACSSGTSGHYRIRGSKEDVQWIQRRLKNPN